MKSLYESILDDEEVLISKTKETANNWFVVLKAMISEPSSKAKDIINMLKKDKGFEKDIMSVFNDKNDIEIKSLLWGPSERHISIFHKNQQVMLPDIEFAYCKVENVYGDTIFVMKFNNYNMLNPCIEKNIKSKQAWSAIPNKLCKKYKLNSKPSHFMAGQMFIY
jgi:hypothetical protein